MGVPEPVTAADDPNGRAVTAIGPARPVPPDVAEILPTISSSISASTAFAVLVASPVASVARLIVRVLLSTPV